ncbi:MAG: glycosyltransferase family 4 protein [Alphaproteobacteria bacterium]|nr:glycosyltransferase [Rhizobiaceae bacterium]MBU3963851.1 glycosyltransferase family 4 protein [Alphaproteobacteria bacterium]MBU4051559.1 glycosyltransferase family 4 protein [Alphaproteobacteria bacterium]MBU4087157.1 glycosyltransferase family 4 protein [Alphaproteobacteria bacterium]MBU4156314.1 glycosyltransferase family 4 protein [Alphaproteobacteria bacterium]
MTKSRRVAFIGNSLPRQCGIATFTTDLSHALAASDRGVETRIIAMTDDKLHYAYPEDVVFEIRDGEIEDYGTAARILNNGGYDAVSLQHEFGIFGGPDGEFILTLLAQLRIPVITTLHTILAEPTPGQLRVLQKVAGASNRVVAMAQKGRALLESVYGVDPAKIDVIAHGIPNRPFHDPELAKAKHGYAGRPVILTFGLLSPNKGIEVVIDAMPAILTQRPDALYVVLGATHPNLLRQEGEAYRDRLGARAEQIGVGQSVVFLNQFVDVPTLLDFIAMCDVYVTPYLDEAQMTSGTLAYSFGMGSAVVSTPYWHAQELLDQGRGMLVPFGDAGATGQAIASLLGNDDRRMAMRRAAYDTGRSMIWSQIASLYLDSVEKARSAYRPRLVSDLVAQRITRPPQITSLKLGHFHTMCDDTGIFQHAVYSVPDRAHGYCVDDNARALVLATHLATAGETGISDRRTASFAAFIQHAWNPDLQRFRNFMSFDRRWLEEQGSEDSHGRTLWALGVCALSDNDRPRRRWASALFAQAIPTVLGFQSPRAWAFALIGLDAYCRANPEDMSSRALRLQLAERLIDLERRVSNGDRHWFEEGLSYENARLPQALILAGLATGTAHFVACGLRTLRWLMTQQTGENGQFRPIGTDGFFDLGDAPKRFDQQPVEATATISACLAADAATEDKSWLETAFRTFNWFTGGNDHGVSLVDPETGSCRDGLHPDRPNENRGAESVLCYLISCAEIGRASRLVRPVPQPSEFRQSS